MNTSTHTVSHPAKLPRDRGPVRSFWRPLQDLEERKQTIINWIIVFTVLSLFVTGLVLVAYDYYVSDTPAIARPISW